MWCHILEWLSFVDWQYKFESFHEFFNLTPGWPLWNLSSRGHTTRASNFWQIGSALNRVDQKCDIALRDNKTEKPLSLQHYEKTDKTDDNSKGSLGNSQSSSLSKNLSNSLSNRLKNLSSTLWNHRINCLSNCTLLYLINVHDGIKCAGLKIKPNLGILEI